MTAALAYKRIRSEKGTGEEVLITSLEVSQHPEPAAAELTDAFGVI